MFRDISTKHPLLAAISAGVVVVVVVVVTPAKPSITERASPPNNSTS